MTLRTRRIIFCALVVLFLLSGGGVVSYANGWRLNPRTFVPVKTGGIYIESVPRDAEIFLDGKAVRNTSGLISSGTLISGLVPGRYEIAVHKEGFSTWRRALQVLPSLVTKADRVRLVPQRGVAVPLPIPAAEIEIVRDELAVTFENGEVALGGTRLPGTKLVAPNANGSAAIIFDRNHNAYLSVPLPAARPATNLTVLFNNLKERTLNLSGTVLPRAVAPHPFDAKKVIVRTERGLYIIDTERLTIAQLAGGTGNATITAAFAEGQGIAWTEYKERRRESALMTADLIIRSPSRLATIAGTVSGIEASPAGGFLLLTDDGRLALLPRSAQEPTILENGAASLSVSPKDARIVVLLRDGSLALWDLRETPKRVALPVVADDVLWHKDGAHIFVRRGSSALFVELFEDGEIFETPLSDAAADMTYDASRNLIYLLEGGALRALEL